MTLASPIAVASTGKEFVAQPDQQSKQNDAEDQAAGNQFFLDRQKRLMLHLFQFLGKFGLVGHRELLWLQPVASGGFIPWKKSQEMPRPIQMMNPNRQTR